jgi:hypothetical protein
MALDDTGSDLIMNTKNKHTSRDIQKNGLKNVILEQTNSTG